MTEQTTPKSRVSLAHELLPRVAQLIEEHPFQPHPLFTSGHAQTLAAYAWPRRRILRNQHDEERLFEVAPGIRILTHCRWQPDRRACPTILLWHGIEGSSSSVYMLAMAQKGFAAGFNILRMNLRNCGGTEHLTPTLYHGGLSEDLRAVVTELIEQDGLTKLLLVGFSLGGNMVLKLAAEYEESFPREIYGACVVSPSVDLSASADMICLRSNWLYHRDFLRRLRGRIRLKAQLFPELYDTKNLHLIRTIRDFDERYTAGAHGFKSVADYYHQASSVRLLERIRIPTLIIHAQDDPFIPFAPLRTSAAVTNPSILLIDPERGGHVAFLAAKPRRKLNGHGSSSQAPGSAIPSSGIRTQDSVLQYSLEEDRFWAENRVLDFCRIAAANK